MRIANTYIYIYICSYYEPNNLLRRTRIDFRIIVVHPTMVSIQYINRANIGFYDYVVAADVEAA